MPLAFGGQAINNLAVAGHKLSGLAAGGHVIWPSMVASTLDPARTSLATLSNGNLTIASTATNGIGISTSSRNSGKYHLEITANHSTSANLAYGLVKASFNLNNWVGQDANSFGVWSGIGSFQTYFNNVGSSIMTGGWGQGDVVAFEFDLSARLLWFLNRTSSSPWNVNTFANPATGVGGISFSGLTGPYFFCANPYATGTITTVNFGATPFSVTPSSGFWAWL